MSGKGEMGMGTVLLGAVAAGGIMWFALSGPASPKADAEPVSTAAPGTVATGPCAGMKIAAADALCPESVVMVGRDGKTAWVSVDRWRSAWGSGYRFQASDTIEVAAGKFTGFDIFRYSGRELNAIVEDDRFSENWRLRGERVKLTE